LESDPQYPTARDVDAAVDELAQNPEIGARKKGDLVALRVFKFRSAGQLFLLGYTLDEVVRLAYLEAVGPMKISIGI
jgi:hypothetical protein